MTFTISFNDATRNLQCKVKIDDFTTKTSTNVDIYKKEDIDIGHYMPKITVMAKELCEFGVTINVCHFTNIFRRQHQLLLFTGLIRIFESRGSRPSSQQFMSVNLVRTTQKVEGSQ